MSTEAIKYPDTPRDRYLRDPAFRALVDFMVSAIQQNKYSPSEMREAALLASIVYEEHQVRRFFHDPFFFQEEPED